ALDVVEPARIAVESSVVAALRHGGEQVLDLLRCRRLGVDRAEHVPGAVLGVAVRVVVPGRGPPRLAVVRVPAVAPCEGPRDTLEVASHVAEAARARAA